MAFKKISFVYSVIFASVFILTSFSLTRAVDFDYPKTEDQSTTELPGNPGVENTNFSGSVVNVGQYQYSAENLNLDFNATEIQAAGGIKGWFKSRWQYISSIGQIRISNPGITRFVQAGEKYNPLNWLYGKQVVGIANGVSDGQWRNVLNNLGIVGLKTVGVIGAAVLTGVAAGKVLIFATSSKLLAGFSAVVVKGYNAVIKTVNSAASWIVKTIPGLPKVVDKALAFAEKTTTRVTSIMNKFSYAGSRFLGVVQKTIETAEKVFKFFEKHPLLKKIAQRTVISLGSGILALTTAFTGIAINNALNTPDPVVTQNNTSPTTLKNTGKTTTTGTTSKASTNSTTSKTTTTNTKPATTQTTSSSVSGGTSTTTQAQATTTSSTQTATPKTTGVTTALATTAAPKNATTTTTNATTKAASGSSEKTATTSTPKTASAATTSTDKAEASWLRNTVSTLASKVGSVPKVVIEFAKSDLPRIMNPDNYFGENASPLQKKISYAAVGAWGVFGTLLASTAGYWHWKRRNAPADIIEN